MLQIILFVFATFCAVAMSVVDWRQRLIPDVFLFPFLLAGLVLASNGALTWVSGGITESAIAAVVGYGLGTVMNFIFKKFAVDKDKNSDKAGATAEHCTLHSEHSPIGMGDIKLLAVGGLWLGITGLSITLVVSCALGYIWGLRAKQKFVPFAPFFFAGAALAIVVLLIW